MLNKRSLRLFLLKWLSLIPAAKRDRFGSVPDTSNILLVRPDHIGDVLFTTPALRALRKALPQANITYLVGEWSQEIVQNNPNVDRVITCQFPYFSRLPRASLLEPYTLLIKEARRIRRFGFDIAVNLRFDFWWGAMLSYFAGIPLRIGYDIAECRPFLSRFVPYVPQRHEVEQNISLIEHLIDRGHAPEPGYLDFLPGKEDEALAQAWLSQSPQGKRLATASRSTRVASGDLRRLVILHPGAGAPVKLWTSSNFAHIGDVLARKHNVQIILTGSASEFCLLKEIESMIEVPVRILSGANLGQLAALLHRCSLAIGVDTGIMHLAVAMGTPTVHLYGPVSDVSFGPWGERDKHIVVKSDMPCMPCNRLDYTIDELEAHPCVRAIPAEAVLAAAEKLLAR